MIVVSEIGEQWSPKIEPARTPESVLTIFRCTSLAGKPAEVHRLKERGVTIGMIIAIVAHEVPVEKLITAEIKNVRAGRSLGEKSPLETLTT